MSQFKVVEHPDLIENRLNIVTMSDVVSKPIDWMWKRRFALGRLSLLVGRPGLGKSFITCDMASRISRGASWPDGCYCPKGDSLLIIAEDNHEDTIKPRLDACEADTSRIHVLLGEVHNVEGQQSEVAFNLRNIHQLERALKANPMIRFVVIDPIGSFLGGKVDAHRDNEVRDVLGPLGKIAEDHSVCILLVMHTRKDSGGGYADDAALGSRAFTGIARTVWHLIEKDGKKLFLPGKNNLSAPADGLSFEIEGDPSRIHWDEAAVTMSADEAISDCKSSKVDQAVAWLEDRLNRGSEEVQNIKTDASRRGFSSRTIERAAKAIGVSRIRQVENGPWWWQIEPRQKF